ncbi:MAG: molybdopterin biosynthesis protein [Pirellulaceae bacterium]|nr:molybdopterin biosynthesis protein [Pirellulaceae bacterium]
MSFQSQFLNVIDRDEAQRRFEGALDLSPCAAEKVPLAAALGRVLADQIHSPVDVPSFDRSNVDGFAVRAADTFGASEQQPRKLQLLTESIATAIVPTATLQTGEAMSIATGGMLPRGADGVVMVEHTDSEAGTLLVRRAISPGANVAFAGTDIARGELVLHAGEVLTSRETGLLAAVGVAEIAVVGRPRVAILSTGDEIIPPGQPMRPALVYDSNARILADAVRELGGEPVELGIVADDLAELRKRLTTALEACELVLLSGGTSKGAGDLSYRVISDLTEPGIVAHGVALKPGKPICLAATGGKGVVVLPGFPTSAIFTFHEFVAPVIRRLAGLPAAARQTVGAELAVKVNSEIGRTEYLLVNLVERAAESVSVAKPKWLAWPLGKGSGSVTTFSRADGFITIGRHEEIVEATARVEVTLLGRDLAPADLVVIGSHCVGLDLLLARLQARGWRTKLLAVGSTAGLDAAKRGQCDLAGIHLLDPATSTYNAPFITPDLKLIRGYERMQGVVFRPGDPRFAGHSAESAIAAAKLDQDCLMVNRNAGSGTRILIDRLLAGAIPAGYAVQPKSHSAVAAAVAQGRADWGICIESVARQASLGFLPLAAEQYDFVIPCARLARPAVRAFIELLADERIVAELAGLQLNRVSGQPATLD